MPNRPRTDPVGASPYVLALRAELGSGRMRRIAAFAFGDRQVELRVGLDTLWAIVRYGSNPGGTALRAAYAPGGFTARRVRRKPGEVARIQLDGALGRHVVSFALSTDPIALLRITTRLTPAAPMLVPFLPRDLYPLGDGDDPLKARGRVEAAQRGLNSGLCYFHRDEPQFGSMLYFQNLTALNPYFQATHTKPDAAVGGEWPEIGYLPPTPPQSGTPPTNPLPAGVEVTLSDAMLVIKDDSPADERHSARLFLQMLGTVYRKLDQPERDFRDWPDRAARTLHDLDKAPEATIRHYGHRYPRPYVDAEYPDAMVQMTLLASLRDYGAWLKEPLPLEAEFAGGVGRFYDPKLKTIRRYLPNVGDDKDADAVDSWYLYHPLLNLGRLAQDGDAKARRLFEGSLEFAIRAAHHFRYAWPIQFKVTDFSVIVEARNDDGLGQTDVGGLYAYVMLQAYELADDPRFLAEAGKAIDAAANMRFELNYQANLTAWGAAACLRLWRITNEDRYLAQSYVYLASFFHNTAIWESEIAHARHYRNFLGVCALHDGPYMALYECFDSFAAFERYARESGPDLDPSVRLLVHDYCRFALDRAWFYYPDALPKEILCGKPRNGHIDPKLSFPLEDLYVGGDIAGQVGQEVYGAGAAFVFASRAFHRIEGSDFTLFCDRFLLAIQRTGERSLNFQLGADPASTATLALIPAPGKRAPRARIAWADGTKVRLQRREGRIECTLPASGLFTLAW